MDERRNLPPWWSRRTDETGKPIRADVWECAPKAWDRVCREIGRVLGDCDEAAPIFEKAIRAVSIYLDKYGIEAHDPTGLLIAAASRLARRLARQRNRTIAIGSGSDFDAFLHAPDWSDQVNRQLFLQQLIDALRPEMQGVLRLRLEGFEWDDIGRMLNSKPATIRKAFWREIRVAQLRLLRREAMPRKPRNDGER